MASATNLGDAQTPDQEACVSYAKRDNIAVGCLGTADQTDAALTVVETRAASRETDRYDVSGGHLGSHFVTNGQVYAPDAADYDAAGADRAAP